MGPRHIPTVGTWGEAVCDERGNPVQPRHFWGWVSSTDPSTLELGLRYRGTSFIRNTPLLGPYSRTMPRVLWWFKGGCCFL